MNKLKLLTVLLAVVLIVSICFNAFLGTQNLSLSNQSSDETKLEMNTILSQAQVAVDAELQRIGNSLIYASQQLSTTGISGAQARAVVSALAANSSFIIDAATQDLNNIMVTVEPSAYSYSEGRDVGKEVWLNPNPDGPITPVMTPVIPLVENLTGVAMAAPIFNANKVMIGTVSVIFDPEVLLNATITPILENKSYEFITMQTDGQTLYDSDPTKQPTNILTNPTFASQTELIAVTHRIANEYSGYGTYDASTTANQSKPHEVYWTTLTAYGVDWRFAIIHNLYS